MPFIRKTYVVTTESVDFVSLQHDIVGAIRDASATNGMLCVTVPKGGAGLLIFKNSPELREGIAPHIQPAMLPRSIVLPIADGATVLAPYEDVVLVDYDPKVQRREVVIAVTVESEGEAVER